LLVEAGRGRAAAALETTPDAVTYAAGEYQAQGRRIALVALARRSYASGLAPWRVECEIEVHPTFPNGCHVAEVEIDRETGVARVCRYACVDDFGVIVNETVVEGQLHGGIAQGIGEALLEAVRYDASSGQLLTGTLSDYALPTGDALPEIASAFHAVPCTTNSLGAKGAGEAGTTGGVCAVMNALHDAVRPCGIRHLDKPVTSERLWRALRGAGRQEPGASDPTRRSATSIDPLPGGS
jgi:carbon-monoxide dehydrogenase large subunit